MNDDTTRDPGLPNPFMLHLSYDKVPTLVYVQKEGHGIGELYLNGKRIKGLRKIIIEAESRDDRACFPELKLEVYPKALADSITKED